MHISKPGPPRSAYVYFLLALILIYALVYVLLQDIILSPHGMIYLLASLVIASIAYTVLFWKPRNSTLVFLSIILPCFLNIISAILSWGSKPLGHEDFGRDVRWSRVMSTLGFWKYNIEAGVYAVLPVQSFINYVYGGIALHSATFELSALILMLLIRTLIAIAVYLIITLLFRSDRVKYALPLIALLMGGTVVSAYTLSGVLAIIALYRSLTMYSYRRHISSEMIVIFTLSLTSMITHMGAFSILVMFATMLLIPHLKKLHHTFFMFSLTLVMLPITYSTINYAAFMQASGFIETLIRTIYNPSLLETFEFAATIQMYKSPLWLLRYADLFLYPLILLTLLVCLIKHDVRFRSSELVNDPFMIILSITVALQHALGIVFYFISRNSTYYRYFSSISAIFVILLTLVYMNWFKTYKGYSGALQALLYVFLQASVLIAQLHHTMAPLLHFNKDIVPDTLSHNISITVEHLFDETLALNVYSLFLPIGRNPYGTLDYWILRYNIERGNMPKNTVIMITTSKNPLGIYLYRELVTYRIDEVDLLLSAGSVVVVYYCRA